LPRGIIAYDWYYYPFGGKPRVELYNFAEHDLLPALKKQGIAYYGCPMNGAFRHEPLPLFGDRLANIRSWWQRCIAVNAEGFLVTSWEAYRLAFETTSVVDAAAANLWLEPARDDATAMLARGLERMFKLKAALPLARALLAADDYSFCGYARWQINDRWDVFAGNESLKSYQAEERFFRRLLRADLPWPKAFTASLAFRLYVAQRDVFVRQAARDVFKLRRMGPDNPDARARLKTMQEAATAFNRALKAGRRAAGAMWARTRNPQAHGQNEAALDADEQRLASWRVWLKCAAKESKLIGQATPVCGAWQLQFMVHNFAPAVRKVIVEQQAADGSWCELAGRFTLEFRALAARPRTRLKREFTVPVGSPAAKLRLAVRGVGQVALSHVVLTNGVKAQRSRGFDQKVILGRPAPVQGFPAFDWQKNEAARLLDFPA